MTCTQFDVRDYLLGEQPEAERASLERHVVGCETCAMELEQLRLTRGALMSLREEEPPRRIAFVSDKVFEPSPVRRWLSAFWMSGARLGFASAAMLSIALLYSALRPPPKILVPVAAAHVDVRAIVDEAVNKALAAQDKKTRELFAASEQRHRMEEQALALRVSDYLTNIEKRYAVARASVVNYGEGGQ